MAPDAGFWTAILAALAGLGLSVGIERLMRPAASLVRPWAAWALHAGLWLLAYVVFVLLLGRPVFAVALVSAFLLMFVLVNNAKFKALREPFVFQDYEYFTDAIRHPRLYIPFLGWGKFLLAAAGFVSAVAIGLWGESVPALRWSWSGQGGALAVLGGLSLALLGWGSRRRLPVSLSPEQDLPALGLLASLWRYWQQGRQRPDAQSPLKALEGAGHAPVLPHLVSVQSESFFDARTLWDGIRRDILAEFDRFKAEAAVQGGLRVPAWGANTVRSEFSFLSGIANHALGVHRFNPYRAVSAGWQVETLASWLKSRGYRTICIHPYPASFYQRDLVYPRFGFDEFLDIRAFTDVALTGPYVGDIAVAEKVASLLSQAREPVFIHVITMENHGPLHLEKVAPGEVERLYSRPPEAGCDDLTIYLRHVRNADAMLARLRQSLMNCGRPASLCWYGDHVPIMPSVYAALGAPSGEVDFFLWNTGCGAPTQIRADLDVHELAQQWMRASGVLN